MKMSLENLLEATNRLQRALTVKKDWSRIYTPGRDRLLMLAVEGSNGASLTITLCDKDMVRLAELLEEIFNKHLEDAQAAHADAAFAVSFPKNGDLEEESSATW